jgi:hypothetical protein
MHDEIQRRKSLRESQDFSGLVPPINLPKMPEVSPPSAPTPAPRQARTYTIRSCTFVKRRSTLPELFLECEVDHAYTTAEVFLSTLRNALLSGGLAALQETLTIILYNNCHGRPFIPLPAYQAKEIPKLPPSTQEIPDFLLAGEWTT